MSKTQNEPRESPVFKVRRWECVRAWDQLLLCLHSDDGETRVFALDRDQAENLGLDIQEANLRAPED